MTEQFEVCQERVWTKGPWSTAHKCGRKVKAEGLCGIHLRAKRLREEKSQKLREEKSQKAAQLNLTVTVDLDPKVWASEYGLVAEEAAADAPRLLAELLLAGLRNHQYLLDRVRIQQDNEVLADTASRDIEDVIASDYQGLLDDETGEGLDVPQVC